MATALDLNFDLGGMRHTATASKSFVRLVSMVLARRLTTTFYEVFGLAQIFHVTLEKTSVLYVYLGQECFLIYFYSLLLTFHFSLPMAKYMRPENHKPNTRTTLLDYF